MYYLGVDPGWTNLGWCLMKDDKPVIHGTLCPKSIGLGKTAHHLFDLLIKSGINPKLISMVCVERFVYFKGVHNPDSENILMVIGEFNCMCSSDEYKIPMKMFRSIEWKTALSKHLWLKCAFKNPSDSFDKEYSIAAAKCATGVLFKTDHEADAGCLSYLAKEYCKTLSM